MISVEMKIRYNNETHIFNARKSKSYFLKQKLKIKTACVLTYIYQIRLKWKALVTLNIR